MEAARIRGPPNLHLHSFQRVSRENGAPEASEVQFLFRRGAKEGLERAYDNAAPSRFRRKARKGRQVALVRSLGHCRACKQRDPTSEDTRTGRRNLARENSSGLARREFSPRLKSRAVFPQDLLGGEGRGRGEESASSLARVDGSRGRDFPST